MANLILTTDGWEDRIRYKLGVDSAYLPDTVLQQPDIITVAEANIIKLVGDGYSELTGDDRTYLEVATVCECSRIVCPTLKARLPVMERGPQAEHQLAVDWGKRQSELEAERDHYLAKISTFTFPSLTQFRLI